MKRDDTICPACKRYIGLWNRNGERVGSEFHFAKRKEHSEFIGGLSRRLMWEVKPYWICNRGDS
jgi:hypothetical protein